MSKQNSGTTQSVKKRTIKQRFFGFLRRHRLKMEIFLILLVILFIFLFDRIVYTIHSGERGVMYYRFYGGTVTDWTFGEGVHLIFPWDYMYIYDIRVHQEEHKFNVLTEDGLTVGLSVSIRFHPRTEQLGFLHKLVGPNYIEKIVIPEIQSALRVIMGQYEPQEIFTTQENLLQTILHEALLQVSEKYINLDDLLIKDVVLPPVIKDAIERKLQQEQIALQYEYRLLEEEQEAKRKKIEAQGIRDFQDIVSEGISEQLLRWRGIEATLELARSNNSKVIVIGGRDGLPLILNTEDTMSGGISSASEIQSATALSSSFSSSITRPLNFRGQNQR